MILKIILIVMTVISLITFILYGVDKQKAKHNAWRIKEAVLLGFTFFGGWLGAILGSILFHHKTRKWYFVLTIIISTIIAISLIIYLLIKGY